MNRKMRWIFCLVSLFFCCHQLFSNPLIMTNSQMPRVLLTAPHAICDNERENVCDQSSLQNAVLLYHSLISVGIPTALLIPITHRFVWDLNRWHSIEQFYHRVFREYLEKRPIVLIDVHSFPPDYKWGLPKTPDVVLLDSRTPFQTLSLDFSNALSPFDIDIKIVPGGENALVKTADAFGIKNTMLIEFNDDLSLQKRHIIFKHLTQLLKKIIKEK